MCSVSKNAMWMTEIGKSSNKDTKRLEFVICSYMCVIQFIMHTYYIHFEETGARVCPIVYSEKEFRNQMMRTAVSKYVYVIMHTSSIYSKFFGVFSTKFRHSIWGFFIFIFRKNKQTNQWLESWAKKEEWTNKLKAFVRNIILYRVSWYDDIKLWIVWMNYHATDVSNNYLNIYSVIFGRLLPFTRSTFCVPPLLNFILWVCFRIILLLLLFL